MAPCLNTKKEALIGLYIKDRLSGRTEAVIKSIIGAVIEVHRELGPGYLEKVYERALVLELHHRRLSCLTQVPVAIQYKGVEIHGQVLDMVVENMDMVQKHIILGNTFLTQRRSVFLEGRGKQF